MENNVEEDFLSKIHAVGDVMTALKMKSDKYKNEDSVQKMYKELKPECNNLFDDNDIDNSKKKAKAAGLILSKALVDSEYSLYCLHSLHSPYTNHFKQCPM